MDDASFGSAVPSITSAKATGCYKSCIEKSAHSCITMRSAHESSKGTLLPFCLPICIAWVLSVPEARKTIKAMHEDFFPSVYPICIAWVLLVPEARKTIKAMQSLA